MYVLLGANGNANIIVVLEDELLPLDLGVQPWERFERADHRLGE